MLFYVVFLVCFFKLVPSSGVECLCPQGLA